MDRRHARHRGVLNPTQELDGYNLFVVQLDRFVSRDSCFRPNEGMYDGDRRHSATCRGYLRDLFAYEVANCRCILRLPRAGCARWPGEILHPMWDSDAPGRCDYANLVFVCRG